jgi:hypothetical protein
VIHDDRVVVTRRTKDTRQPEGYISEAAMSTIILGAEAKNAVTVENGSGQSDAVKQ